VNIRLHTLSEVTSVSGAPGNLTVTVQQQPRYVNPEKCTGCGTCLEVCPIHYQVQMPEQVQRARTAYAEATDEATVAAIIDAYREERGNLLPILLNINRHFNWLPRPALEHLSSELGLPLTEILRVASFYNAFSLVPRGKHIINVCLGTGCFVKGSPRLLEQLEKILKIKHAQTTEDRLFTLEIVRCIGCCALAPAIRVGNDTYGRLSADNVPEIVDYYRKAVGS